MMKRVQQGPITIDYDDDRPIHRMQITIEGMGAPHHLDYLAEIIDQAFLAHGEEEFEAFGIISQAVRGVE